MVKDCRCHYLMQTRVRNSCAEANFLTFFATQKQHLRSQLCQNYVNLGWVGELNHLIASLVWLYSSRILPALSECETHLGEWETHLKLLLTRVRGNLEFGDSDLYGPTEGFIVQWCQLWSTMSQGTLVLQTTAGWLLDSINCLSNC